MSSQRGLFLLLLACSLVILTTTNAALTSGQKASILQLHNQYRAKILACQVQGQPPAKAMPMLVWDEQLAMKAQSWASQCRAGHDPGQARKVPAYQWVGQNWAGAMSAEQGISLWFDEYKYYNGQSGKCSYGKMCGHYTQMVWAKTRAVGCGLADCSRINGFKASLVCNYGEGGNYPGQLPYIVGSRQDCRRGIQQPVPQPMPNQQPSPYQQPGTGGGGKQKCCCCPA